MTWCDNLSVGSLASNVVFYSRTKHIKIDVHFVREKVVAKKLGVQYVPTQYQVADILTKPLTISRFELLRAKLNVMEHIRFIKECEESEQNKPQTLMCIT